MTGGTGKLGRIVIPQLLKRGDKVEVLTTRTNTELPSAVNIRTGDLTNLSILRKTLSDSGSEVIVHSASNFLDPENVDVKGTENLLEAIQKKKIKHIIYISIVGVEKSQYPYYKAKYEAERMIINTGIPYTILRATQFHHFVLHRLIKPLDTKPGEILQLPENFVFQSIDISDVAKMVVELVGKEPQNGTISVGGPEILPLEKMAQDYLDFLNRKDKIELVPAEAFKVFQTRINLCPDNDYGKVTWTEYLSSNLSYA